MNVYGGIEARMTKQEVKENWIRMKRKEKEITKIKEREEGLVFIGYMNRAIGNDSLGVEGNHAAVSHGGGLIRELLEDKEYVLLNA